MGTHNRDQLVKPEWMSDEDFQGLLDATSSYERIKGDCKEDVKRYQASPAGWGDGSGSPSGLPTLLLYAIGAKSGQERITPLVFFNNGGSPVIVGSLAGYDEHPAWVHNLNANPDCKVQVSEDIFEATARDITDAERTALWPQMTAMFPPWGYFQDQTDRPFAVKILERK